MFAPRLEGHDLAGALQTGRDQVLFPLIPDDKAHLIALDRCVERAGRSERWRRGDDDNGPHTQDSLRWKAVEVRLYSDERFQQERKEDIGKYGTEMQATNDGWQFSIGLRDSEGRIEDDPGFHGAFKVEIDDVPETGPPRPRKAAESGPA
jgi:hypothetical protein